MRYSKSGTLALGMLLIFVSNPKWATGETRKLTDAEMRSEIGGTVYPGYCVSMIPNSNCTGDAATLCAGQPPCSPGKAVEISTSRANVNQYGCSGGPTFPGACALTTYACVWADEAQCTGSPPDIYGQRFCGVFTPWNRVPSGAYVIGHGNQCP